MSSILAGVASKLTPRFFGTMISTAAGYSAGRAIGPVLSPGLQLLKNDINAAFPYVPPDAGTLAVGVAQGQVDETKARTWAAMHGIGDSQFSALIDVAKAGPALGLAYQAWRRDELTDTEFETALTRAAIEPHWFKALKSLKAEKLDPAQVAAAIHRGLIPDPGLLKGEQPSGPRKVESYPVYPIDPLEEAKAAGYDRNHVGVLVGLQGLPMGPHEAAQAFFRGIITRGDYIAAFNESNNRNEWAEALLEQTRQIPTARDFFENALRGYHDLAWAQKEAQRHGMSPADSLVIYQNQGRPMNVRQITQALARGGVFKPEPGEITDPFEAAIVEGNLKPAYYDLAKANRYTLPSAFTMKSLTQAGTWSAAKAEQRLKEAGWIPEDAHEAALDWSGGVTSAGKALTKAELIDEYEGGFITQSELRDHLAALGYAGPGLELEIHLADARRIKSWRDKAITALGKSYVGSTMDRAAADTYLQDLQVVDPDTRTRILDIWDLERTFG